MDCVRQPSIGFLVRFWRTAEGNRQDMWLGEVRHVTTGHSIQFRGLDQLFSILERVLAVAADPVVPAEEVDGEYYQEEEVQAPTRKL
ncbi:MAG: hypothetical protein AB1776_01480 [Bacillota bacterium]